MAKLNSHMTVGVAADTSPADREMRRFKSDIKKSKEILEPLDGIFKKIEKSSSEGAISMSQFALAMGRNQERVEKFTKEQNRLTAAFERMKRFEGMSFEQITAELDKEARAARKAATEMERLDKITLKLKENALTPKDVRNRGTADVNKLLGLGKISNAEAEQEVKRLREIYAKATAVGPKVEPVHPLAASLGSFKLAVGQFLGPIALAYTAMETLRKAFQINSEVQKAEASLRAFTGSAREARNIVTDIRKATGSTSGITAGLLSARTLAQFSGNTSTVSEQVTVLNRIAGGDSERLQTLALAFGQVQAAGRLMGQEVIQFVNSGFNPLLAISEKTGKSMARLKAEMEAGLISSRDVTIALVESTTAGGRFATVLDERLKTSAGQFDVLKGQSQELALALGEAFDPAVKAGLASINEEIKSSISLFAKLRKLTGTESTGGQNEPFLKIGGLFTQSERLGELIKVAANLQAGNKEGLFGSLGNLRESIGSSFDSFFPKDMLKEIQKARDAKKEIEDLRLRANLVGRDTLKEDERKQLDAANKKDGITEREEAKQEAVLERNKKLRKNKIDEVFETIKLDAELKAVKSRFGETTKEVLQGILDSSTTQQAEKVRLLISEGKTLKEIIGSIDAYTAQEAMRVQKILDANEAIKNRMKAEEDEKKQRERAKDKITDLEKEVAYERDLLSMSKERARLKQLLASKDFTGKEAKRIVELEAQKEALEQLKKRKEDFKESLTNLRSKKGQDSELIDSIATLDAALARGEITRQEAKSIQDRLLTDSVKSNRNSLDTNAVEINSGEMAKIISDLQKSQIEPQLIEMRKQVKLQEINNAILARANIILQGLQDKIPAIGAKGK